MRVVPGDVHDRVLVQPVDARTWAVRVAPVRPRDLPPPRSWADATFRPVAVLEEAHEDERPADPLGFGDVAGVVDEAVELRIRHGGGVDVERPHAHAPTRAFAVVRIRETVLAP